MTSRLRKEVQIFKEVPAHCRAFQLPYHQQMLICIARLHWCLGVR